MRILSTLLVAGTAIVLFQSPHILGEVRDTITGANDTSPPASEATQDTYARLCPLLGVWSDLDASGRKATARTIERMARQQAKETDDPALKAFLIVVPQALGTTSDMQTQAAKALIDRECNAHGA